MLVAPFTTADYLAVVARTFEMDVNAIRPHPKPRASGLASCARQQAFSMAGTEHDAYDLDGSARALDEKLTAEQGRMFEELSVSVIKTLGFEITDRQVELPPDYPVTGHPDGKIGPLIWEHKHLGRYAYEKILKVGLMKAEPGYVVQTMLYGDALGKAPGSLFTIVAQDGSSVRGDMTANLRAKKPEVRWATSPDVNPKVNIVPLDLAPLYHGLLPTALYRAAWLTEWKEVDGDPAHVAREFDADLREEKWVRDGEGDRKQVDRAPFPCGWCPYLQKCLAAGPGGEVAPAFPWKEEADDATE